MKILKMLTLVFALALPATAAFAEAESSASGGAAETATPSGAVATPGSERLDHVLRGEPRPQWSDVVTAAYFNPVPGLGVGCIPVGCENDSICVSVGCRSCKPLPVPDDLGNKGRCE